IGASFAPSPWATPTRGSPSRARPSSTPLADSDTRATGEYVDLAQPLIVNAPSVTTASSGGVSRLPSTSGGRGYGTPWGSIVGSPSTETVMGSSRTPPWAASG